MILPFKKTSVYAGFGSVSGILKFENEILEIEYLTSDEIIRFFKSDTKQINLNLSDIESVEIKKSWFSYRLVIDVKRLKSIEGFPAVNGNQVNFKISKSDLEKLKNLKSNLLLAISEYKLNELDSDSFDSQKHIESTDFHQNRDRNESDAFEKKKLPNALREQKDDG